MNFLSARPDDSMDTDQDEDAENDDDEDESDDDEESIDDIDIDLTEDLVSDASGVYLNKSAKNEIDADDDIEILIEEQAQNADIVSRVFNLLSKIRTLGKLSRESNIICNHIIIKAQEKKLEYVNLIIDFHVRWNTTFLMLNRFIKFKEIINNITLAPEKIDGITKQNINKLKKLNLSNPEWELIDTLTNSFYRIFI